MDMPTPITVKTDIRSAEEWINADFSLSESEVIVGTADNPIIRPLTKNLIQAPEKAFKTTFLMRFALGISTGQSVFPSLPVKRSHKVLYFHGELSPAELKERVIEAAAHLTRPLDNFFQGRSLSANLVTAQGQAAIRQLVDGYKPEVLVLDPWQSLITGAEENSFKEVSLATAFMDNMIAEGGVTIFLAVHLGKNHSRGARGHSLLAGWRDTLFALNRSGTTLTVKVEPRWAEPPNDLDLTFRDGTLWEKNGPIWTKQEEYIRALLAANRGQLCREAIGLGLGLKDSALRTALMRAKAKGAIHVEEDVVTLPLSHPSSPNNPL